jgi:hypothetical protein
MKNFWVLLGIALLAFSCKTTGDSDKSQEQLQKELKEILQPQETKVAPIEDSIVSDTTTLLAADSSEVTETPNPISE